MITNICLAVLFGIIVAGAGLLSNHPISTVEIGQLAGLAGVFGAGVGLLLTPLASAVSLKSKIEEED